MRQIFISSIAFFCLLMTATWTMAAPKIGQPAPNFSLVDSTGKTVSLDEFKGKTVILEWTNHQCPFVRKHYDSGNMQSTQKSFADDEAVVWLSIVSSAPGKEGFVSAAEANELTKTRQASPDKVLLDPEGLVGKTYSAKTTPHMYIIDTEGSLQYMGAIDSINSADKADISKAENYVLKAMAELKAGKSVSQALTRPYGCSVKYKS